MWSIAICDDSAPEIAQLRTLLSRYAAQTGLSIQLSAYTDGSDLISAYEDNGLRFDLILLDVLLGRANGIDTAAKLRRIGVHAPIVFCTTSRDYAVESYEVEAAGYLVKPIAYEKLKQLLQKLLKKQDCPRLALHVPGGIRYPYYSQILYFESRDHSTYAILDTGETLRCSESLMALEKMLSQDPRFYRCHKAFLVNMDHIERVEDVFILANGSKVPYRIREKKKITDDFYRYFLHRNLELLSDSPVVQKSQPD